MNKKGKRYDHLTDCFSLCCFEKNRLTSRINVWPIKMIISWCHQRLRAMTCRFGRPLGIFFVKVLFILISNDCGYCHWNYDCRLAHHHLCSLENLQCFVFLECNQSQFISFKLQTAFSALTAMRSIFGWCHCWNILTWTRANKLERLLKCRKISYRDASLSFACAIGQQEVFVCGISQASLFSPLADDWYGTDGDEPRRKQTRYQRTIVGAQAPSNLCTFSQCATWI